MRLHRFFQNSNLSDGGFTTRIARWMAAAALALTATGAAAEIVYYHNDLAGSPIAATNAAGQLIWRESYRPYGERLVTAPVNGHRILIHREAGSEFQI